jgi:uncharacterized protein (TIGR02246 family)
MTSNEDHAARIRGLDESWKAAAARRDLDGMLAIYADDAQELLPGLAPIVGREAIRKFYGRVLEQLPHCVYAFEGHETVVAQSADLAVVRGSYRFTPGRTLAGKRSDGKVHRRVAPPRRRLAPSIQHVECVTRELTSGSRHVRCRFSARCTYARDDYLLRTLKLPAQGFQSGSHNQERTWHRRRADARRPGRV